MASEQHIHPFLERFLERWTAEFRRAIESQTSQKPDIAHASVKSLERWSQNAGELLWWKQQTAGKDGFAIWIAAEETCWKGLGGASERDKDPKQAFLELVKQANLNLADAAEAGFSKPFQWREGSAEQPPPALDALVLIEVEISLGGKPLPALLAAIERKAQALEPATGSELSTVPAATVSPMLSRLMDLQLPITVLLGRAVLPIRDVIKISSGSLIELDRQINDYVEVMVQGTVVARGEIVSVRGNYGVRIKEIISRQDRIALQDAA
jgi:flagellar motor switch protein FliN/FliY